MTRRRKLIVVGSLLAVVAGAVWGASVGVQRIRDSASRMADT
jgi:hypothetical protein